MLVSVHRMYNYIQFSSAVYASVYVESIIPFNLVECDCSKYDQSHCFHEILMQITKVHIFLTALFFYP